MIAQVILVMMMMLLDSGRCLVPKPMPTCPATCGDLAIPFPFGASSGCNFDYSFLDTSNYSYNPPKPFSNLGSMDTIDTLVDGDFTVASSLSSDYYSGWQANNSTSGNTLSKFSMSGRRKFDTYGLIQISGFPVSVKSFRNVSGVHIFQFMWLCLSVKTNSEFSSLNLKVPVNEVLEWSVANLSCHDIQKSASSFECYATNTECVDASSGLGYYLTGLWSQPYLYDDIVESIYISIPSFVGDTEIDCSDWYSLRPISPSILYYIYLGILVPAFAISWIIRFSKQKKVAKLRRDMFVRNGGEILEAKQSIQKTLSIFTAEDLKKATNNYDESNVLYQEDHLGIIYKGILPGVKRGVTIHCCPAFDQCKIEILINKLVSLSQISHRNVVKLLGCCLETQVPLVVYEFTTCKTLLDCIVDNSLSWDIRLRIAADTAGALAYLHSATAVPIVHGSLSSSRILLDHGYAVKVNGFALTCLECHCVRIHGDPFMYVDPDYFSSGQLTEKSDVYSFGLILIELLTGRGVMSPAWLQVEESIVKYFLGSSGGVDLLGILDDRLATNDGIVEKLREVGEIAKRCLSCSAHERPTMKEVAISLECFIIC